MPYPLSPVMIAAALFAAGIWAGNEDYMQGTHIHACATIAVVICVTGAFVWKRKEARWRWRIAALCILAFGSGWMANKGAWSGIEAQQVRLTQAGTDNHVGRVVGTPVRSAKTLQATVETHDGVRVRLAIAHELTNGCDIHEGTTLLFTSKLKAYSTHDTNEGYIAYHLHQGIAGSGYVTALRTLDTEPQGLFAKARAWARQRLRQTGIEKRAEALTAALLLADKSGMDKDIKATFTDAGAAHLLALSGMHLGLLMAVLLATFGHAVRHQRRNAACICAVVWAYVAIAGAPLSLVRAAWLQTFVLVAIASKRRVHLFDALCSAMFIMLLFSPHALFDVGFEMSFACVFGLAAVPERFMKHVNWCVDVFRTSVVCTVASMPITLLVFHRITLYGCVSGLLLIPMTFVVIALGVVVIVFPHPILCEMLNEAVGIEIMIAKWFSELPCSVIDFNF